MEITSKAPPPPPPTIVMAFDSGDAWALVSALREYAVAHPDAMRRADWIEWAAKLEKLAKS